MGAYRTYIFFYFRYLLAFFLLSGRYVWAKQTIVLRPSYTPHISVSLMNRINRYVCNQAATMLLMNMCIITDFLPLVKNLFFCFCFRCICYIYFVFHSIFLVFSRFSCFFLAATPTISVRNQPFLKN